MNDENVSPAKRLGATVECNCDDWKRYAHEIFRAQIIAHEQFGYIYHGTLWKFCPWCGVNLYSTVPAEQGGRA